MAETLSRTEQAPIANRNQTISVHRYSDMNKVLASAEQAVALIPDGATILMGGFGLCGIPENLIARCMRAARKI